MRYCPNSVSELKKIIEEYEAISFDVWDTLITRTVLEPEDAFDIVENRAKEMKIEVPHFRKDRHESFFQVVRDNPNLDELYDAFQKITGVSYEVRETLMNLEVQIESEVIVPRKDMVEILNYAVQLGKKVNLISDMYLPGEIMTVLLRQAGVQSYDNLFVSCDYRSLKKDSLYLYYKEKVQADTYLHIGDNLDSDIKMAEQRGMDTVFIKRGYSLLMESVLAQVASKAETFNEQCMVGLLCSHLFNSPFAETKNVTISCAEDLAWLFIAPIISSFMVWFGNEVQKENCDGILFAARDGYLIQKLYGQVQRRFPNLAFPEGMYFLASRALCTQAGIRKDEDIVRLAFTKFCGSFQDLLHYRFCLDEEAILPFDEQQAGNVAEYALLHKDKIFAAASENRKRYLSYMDKQGIEANKSYIYFDFVSSGTCQYYLQRIAPFTLRGKYFCHSIVEDERAEVEVDSLYVNNGVKKADNLLYENYRYLETIMTSMEPSLHYIDRNLEAVYDEETRDEEEMQFIREVHGAIEDYFHYYIAMCNCQEDVSTKMAEILYQYMNHEHVEVACKTLESMQLRDDWVREIALK